MYLENKYTNWYNHIISNAKLRIKSQLSYSENHHILPKSLGGTDEATNLVNLTAREHFICHWLLAKMTIGQDKFKMIYALNGMRRQNKNQNRYDTKITARVYEKIKKDIALISKIQNSNKKLSQEHRLKISQSLSGVPKTEEWKQKMRKPKSELHKKNMKGRLWTTESKEKLSNSLSGRISSLKGIQKSDSTKQKMSDSHKGVIKSKLECPHCRKIVGGHSNYIRWHNDNCKFKIQQNPTN